MNMTRKNLYFVQDVWLKGMKKAKAKNIALSNIIRRLLEMWVDDKIKVDF
jgi:hypothetical protein